MAFLNKFQRVAKSSVRSIDLFKQPVTFYKDNEKKHSSFTAGLFSLGLLIFLLIMFIIVAVQIFQRQTIYFSQENVAPQDTSGDQDVDSTFLFAVGLDGIDAVNGEIKYFEITMTFIQQDQQAKNLTSVPLSQCNLTQWSDQGFANQYNLSQLSQFYCNTDDTQLNVQGQYSSQSFSYYQVTVSPCSSSTTQSPLRCATSAQIADYLEQNDQFSLNFYFINTIINPGSQNYVQTYFDNSNYFSFTLTNGVDSNIYLSSYTIQTDHSIMVHGSDITTDTGVLTDDLASIVQSQVVNNKYANVYIRRALTDLSITRSFDRIDKLLSYIGGLFTTIIGFAGIFMHWYNEIEYEVITLQSINPAQSRSFDPESFNVFKAVPYYFIQTLQKVGINIRWKYYQELHKYRKEGRKSVDMQELMQKVQFAQKVGLVILSKQQYKALLMTDPITQEQTASIKKELQMQKMLIHRLLSQKKSKKSKQKTKTQKASNTRKQSSKKESKKLPRQIEMVEKVSGFVHNEDESHRQKMLQKQEDQPNQELQSEEPQIQPKFKLSKLIGVLGFDEMSRDGQEDNEADQQQDEEVQQEDEEEEETQQKEQSDQKQKQENNQRKQQEQEKEQAQQKKQQQNKKQQDKQEKQQKRQQQEVNEKEQINEQQSQQEQNDQQQKEQQSEQNQKEEDQENEQEGGSQIAKSAQIQEIQKQISFVLSDLQKGIEKGKPISKRIMERINPLIKKKYLKAKSSSKTETKIKDKIKPD